MKLNIDFTLIITVLVLIQLFILNWGSKAEDKITKELNNEDEQDSSDLEEEVSLDIEAFVVHRPNGEEKTYSRKTVA